MRLLKYFLTLMFLFIGCKSVLDTDPTDKNLFDLSVEFDSTQRLVDTLTVKLSWSEITIDSFKEIRIIRLNKHRDPLSYPVGTAQNGWVTIFSTDNSFITSHVDTVKDDAEFIYRVDYVDQLTNYRRAESSITIPQTTQLTIPTDFIDVKTAVESYIIDSGDSVLLLPGLHSTHAFSFFEKNVSLIGLGGAGLTLLEYLATYTESEKLIHDSTFVRINSGLIQGLTIKNGRTYNGAGINASGDAIIRQCHIKNNYAGIWTNGGLGGGLYLTGSAKVINCLIDSNYAENFGSGIYIDALAENVEIINCTLADNNIYSNSPNVNIMNTSIIGTQNEIEFINQAQPKVLYSYVGDYWANNDTTNIIGYLGLSNYYPLDTNLLPSSVCIDAGNPDHAFNDKNGTRNDIGVMGGPYGN